MERDAFEAQLPRIDSSLRARTRRARCAEGDDLVQEVIVTIWAQLPRIKGEDALPYAHGVLSCLMRRSRRKAQRAPLLIGAEALEQAVSEPMAAPPQERRVMVHELGDAIERLDPERRAVVLADLQGYSQAEIAKLLGLREGTVKSRTSRGYQDLRLACEGAERPRRARRAQRRRPAAMAEVPPCGEGDIRRGVLSGPVSWRRPRRRSRGWPLPDRAAA